MSSNNFSKCLFNPLEEDLTGKYPRLKTIMDIAYQTVQEVQDKDLLGQSVITAEKLDDRALRYVICMYDPGSPIIRLYQDLAVRKQQASLIAGYDQADEHLLRELFSYENEAIIALIIEYLKVVNSREWAAIVSVEQVIWELNQRMMLMVKGSLADKDKDLIGAVNMKPKMAKDVIELNDLLTTLEKKFYREDEVVRVKARKIRPETVATM